MRSVERVSAKELAALLVDPLLAERPADADGRAAVLVNGLGATKYEELFVLWNDVRPLLEAAGVRVVLPEVGELVTSLDMAGCSLTVFWEVQERVEASPESERAAATVRDALARMLDVVSENEAELGRLDSVAGDGDHGVGMVRGLRAANAAAQSTTGGVGSVLRSAGAAFGDKAGGTSGMLWGAILEALGDALDDTEPPTAQRVAEGVRRSAEVVHRLGRASVGDKTLLDALVPFAEVLHGEVAAGHPLARAWSTAAKIATESAERTADLLPRIGRARPLAERSLGTPDPGATSMALCLDAASEVLARLLTQPSRG